ncbi:LamG-like jellyroll fold domain-containing protein [Pseudonocardia sp. WMMC193]|uniref:LamG-like jellyroll fold domain-containing protein n=1 Tax=Pseudonocardia sp. WMMC193 TaxID=2911965 RepID=UPI001F407004|nr:LamG-like jellyroll fold domain-containing protein [Pseudonocardia sp. WMMC193]MCF7553837.1 PKD domain-containing protein [Pseudonocardia sp. WMMC193]
MGRTATRRAKVTAALTAVGVAVLGLPFAGIGTAAADTAPPPANPPTTTTVAADALPTVQMNGVVWDQVVVGNTVYATGDFTAARPAGSAAGTNETPRANLLAYTLSTGALVTSWAPTLNAPGLTIDASEDGSTIYVGGDFTQVSGTTRSRIAALDATTGAVKSFNAIAGTTVRAIDVEGNTVYVGGGFSSMGGQPRTRIAAVDGTTGALRPFAPYLDSDVYALTVPPGTNRVVAGGRFRYAGVSSTQNQDVKGLAVFAADTAAVQPWAAYGVFPNYGPKSAIYSLSSSGGQVFGTAYDFGGGSPFEGSFGADLGTGAVNWVAACKGDTYSSFPVNGVLYTVGHPHDCGMIQGHPQENPWTYQRAMATTLTAAADGRKNTYGPYAAYRAPELLHWLPTYNSGTFTGQGQAGWSVTGNSQYIVVGGEFPTVNGIAQQGLSRFAISSVAPNKEGPQANASTNLKPVISSVGPGTARLTWQAAWDRDNKRLTYEILRGANVGSATVVGTLTADSTWWNRPQLSFTDSNAPAGSQTYRVRVKDPLANAVVSNLTTFTVEGTGASSVYLDAVRADGPTNYWRLGEASGTTGFDWVGSRDLTLAAGATRGTAGAVGDGTTATTFPGNATVPASTTGTATAGPQTFSVEAWVRTTSTSGGKIVGFGNSATGSSSSNDRHLYLTNAGKVLFGVNPGSRTVIESPGAINNGQWHHVVGTLSAQGMVLYVDGQQVAARADVTAAQAYNGHWRIGGDNLTSWPSRPTSASLNGAVDDVAVYPAALSAARVSAHFQAAAGTPANVAPTAAFTSTTAGLTANVDASTSTDPDGTIASYAWNFGDGSTGSGVTASRTYAAAGTYQVTLTVTDDDAATNVIVKPVTVTAAPQGAFATDPFARTVASGWGSADVGGPWTIGAGPANYSVADGVGRMQTVAGSTRSAFLTIGQQDVQFSATVDMDKVQTGGGSYVTLQGRRVDASNDYRVKVRYLATGAVSAQFARLVGGTETLIGGAVTIPGLTGAPGEKVRMTFRLTGNGTTTLQAKLWKAVDAEPGAWNLTTTDTTPVLQAAGGVGLQFYLSGSSTNGPLVLAVDDVSAVSSAAP